MDNVNKQSHQIKDLLETAYNRFHTEHGLAKIRPRSFSLLPYRSELQRLKDEAEAFRNSPALLVTEAHFVIRKFFITLGSRARAIFEDCNAGAKSWSKSTLKPVMTQLREHKTHLEKRLDGLKRIQENLDNLDKRIAELESDQQLLLKQQKMAQDMLDRISRPFAGS
jgi:uncharacterized membrane protein YccC